MLHRSLCTILFFSCGMLIYTDLYAQTISLGNIELKVGMTQEHVLSQLGNDYELTKVPIPGNAETWSVQAKPSTKAMDGQVFFQGGKLTAVRKNWTPPNTHYGVEPIEEVISLMARFESEGIQSCSIRTEHQQYVGFSTFTGYITCGTKQIDVLVLTGRLPGLGNELQQQVSVSEWLR